MIHAKILKSQTSLNLTSKLGAKFGTHVPNPAILAMRTPHLVKDALLIFAYPANIDFNYAQRQ